MYEIARKRIQKADAILITAGAGMGVDSGLPDFRGIEGFWKAYPVIKDLGYRFEEMANPRWFEEDPALAWAFYGHRYMLYKQTKPHEGFFKLLDFAKQKKGKYFVFTSNVDGHFQKAGYANTNIVEIHGSINHLQCTKPCSQKITPAENLYFEINTKTFRTTSSLPLCPDCGAIMRPNILMFGDWNWIPARTDMQSMALQRWLDQTVEKKYKITILEFGAGTAVPTVRIFSEQIARQYDATLIRINPRDTEVPNDAIALQMGAKEAIDLILEGL
jgi:NAD-dependent SIR2 family protein deacetylase